MKVFVAATLSSDPAAIGRTMSAAAASGLSTSFTIAAVSAPAALADAVVSMRSSPRPDWETARKNWSLELQVSSVDRRYARRSLSDRNSQMPLNEVFAEARRAYAELPRASHHNTRRASLSEAQSRLMGPPSSSDWRETISGDSRSSAAINCSPLLTRTPGFGPMLLSRAICVAPYRPIL